MNTTFSYDVVLNENHYVIWKYNAKNWLLPDCIALKYKRFGNWKRIHYEEIDVDNDMDQLPHVMIDLFVCHLI